jgi:hypothetical protein
MEMELEMEGHGDGATGHDCKEMDRVEMVKRS